MPSSRDERSPIGSPSPNRVGGRRSLLRAELPPAAEATQPAPTRRARRHTPRRDHAVRADDLTPAIDAKHLHGGGRIKGTAHAVRGILTGECMAMT
ncbi:uncharacterized protein N7459_005792 [Penicillium hispanicum]|uniref:uncharacterized protein n=1 Tax=Penicillium hispanicum TaxID=1080232 RepID=UPI002540D7F4|nr:uncharacterized protein N7459_005792 [Penicillium hispanicum]KAJ5579807.1 hypothetical protein N7459_005792 [Penicillium hispanicum]